MLHMEDDLIQNLDYDCSSNVLFSFYLHPKCKGFSFRGLIA